MTKIRYTWTELGRYAKDGALSFWHGLSCLLWSLVLFVINLALCAAKALSTTIRRAPCTAVGITLSATAILTIAVYMQMKVRLTTAEWQRDSLRMKIDSLSTFDKTKTSYFRYKN